MKSALWYFAGNFAPVPNTRPVGDPAPTSTTGGRQPGAVAADDVEGLAAGAEDDAVRAVLAVADEGAEQSHLVEAVVPLRGPRPVQPRLLAAADDGVQAAEGVQQPLGAAELHVEPLGRGGLAVVREGDAGEFAVLVGGDEPARVV